MTGSISMAVENSANPLLAGLEPERQVEPLSFVIFGANGDLTKRKLIPAVYALFMQGLLPRSFVLLGTSRTHFSHEEFRNAMKEALLKFASDLPFTEESWQRFASSLYYQAADSGTETGFEDIKKTLSALDEKHGTNGRHVFYLSTSPSLYLPIIKGLGKSGLVVKTRANEPAYPRVVIEKPFGHDLASSLNLDEQIHEVLREHQIYRIDHYLGKETVQNIMVFRFANAIFEPLWNRNHIDHIQVTNAETLGVEGRGAYYEEAGALRDMMQNHLMQLMALVLMEPPIAMDAESTRDEKNKVLKSLRPLTAATIDENAVRGQYGPGFILGSQVPGYRQEPSVADSSQTATFAALKLSVDNWRWSGVPIYVRTGKRLAKSITEVAVVFKDPPHRLFENPDKLGQTHIPGNVLVMQIQPDEGISLKFATKQPGPNTTVRWLNMDFKYGSAFGTRTPTAYERLILDCLHGDPSLFARSDFVEASWKYIQPIIEHWENNALDFPNYAAGSWGPAASDALLARTGHTWRRL
ncbi:MAG TPA: glucose-6-phosphate dehydrogenase [Candidatus Obscuribacter sp.]|nr:glucose-6-phosphate dehydrogenase [Candidatus Obscuribacter sp.]